jgi:hypothetical protein
MLIGYQTYQLQAIILRTLSLQVVQLEYLKRLVIDGGSYRDISSV